MIEGHGDDSYKYGDSIELNFSSNVYNHVDHTSLFDYLRSKMRLIESYPEPSPISLEREMAYKMDIGSKNICVTNGATEAIYLIAAVFGMKKSAILVPTFCEYADACRLFQHKVRNIYSLSDIDSSLKTVWICNPNNPTGAVIDKNKIIKYIQDFPNLFFIIDHSYEAFTIKNLLTPAEALNFPNVILLHSMTKHYVIPGLRLGYITANSQILEEIKRRRMPWSVNVMAIEAARFLINNSDKYNLDINMLLAEKERVGQALSSTGLFEIWPSDTHFMLVKMRISNASLLKDYLAIEKGILIRDASNFEGLNNQFFRFAVRNRNENDILLKAINEWINLL